MAGLFRSPLNKMVVIFILLSICMMTESRFVWDFGSYCLNYCAKTRFEFTAVSVCSCQWISANYRRSMLNPILNNDNDDSFKTE